MTIQIKTEEERKGYPKTYLLDEVGDMIDAVLHHNGFLGFNRLSLGFSLSLLQEPFLLRCLVLGPVLQKQLEKTGSCKQHIEHHRLSARQQLVGHR
jgi:hypothetical protein